MALLEFNLNLADFLQTQSKQGLFRLVGKSLVHARHEIITIKKHMAFALERERAYFRISALARAKLQVQPVSK